MLTNYFKIAYRNLKRHKGYAFINVAGLAVGMACCVLIGRYVADERSYDRFHENADRTYRLTVDGYASVQPPAAPALEQDYPGLVEHAVRFWPIKAPATVRSEGRAFAERRISFADPDVFDVFSYPMRAGNPDEALAAPWTIVLTASMAQKYFSDANALGKTLQFWGQDVEVTGVIADVPANTHYPFDALVSMASLESLFGEMMANWTWTDFYTYVLLQEGTSAGQLDAALLPFYGRHTDAPLPPPGLQALTDIHLYSDLQKEVTPGGNTAYLYLLVMIALLVLMVAGVNFMNLATARSLGRAKEVGMRKALGARRPQLVGQFLGEAVLLSLAALLVALLLAELALPLFNSVAGKNLSLGYGESGLVVLALIGLALVVGLGAGIYPAFFLSRFHPATVLKGKTPRASGLTLRKELVVFQFAVSIGLVAGAIVVQQQRAYLQSKNLGFDQERVVVTEAGNYGPFVEALRRQPGVASVAATREVPGQRFQTLPIRTEAMPADSALDVRVMGVDYGLIETMGIQIVEGRPFSLEQGTDGQQAFLVNEAAARVLGTDVSGRLALYNFAEDGATFEVVKEGDVVGVTEDFNYASLHGSVEPLVIHLVTGEDVGQVAVRLRPGDVRAGLAQVEAAWQATNPGDPFDYFFLDSYLEAQYRAEEQLSQVFGGFTALALLIAAFGLFALAAFTATQRTKEIGVRKVLGASVFGLVALLSKDFAKLVLIAFVIAVPMAYLAMQQWLADFAYRIDLGVGVFLLAGGLALAVALAAVSYHAIRVARADPVESLRYE